MYFSILCVYNRCILSLKKYSVLLYIVMWYMSTHEFKLNLWYHAVYGYISQLK